MLRLGSHPELHPLFETLGYALGFAAYRLARRRTGDVLNQQQRWEVIAAAAVGALLGSRLLGLVQQLPRGHLAWSDILRPGGGKTIVGGLLGGWLAVELTKMLARVRIRIRTGDLFAIPLCLGIAVGRIGCLLAGLPDDTYGIPTTLPWGVDFGDGIARHPTQAYEIVFLTLLALVLRFFGRREHRNGSLFRLFMMAYLGWRLLIDCWKPEPAIAGLSAIQWACIAGLVVLLADRLSHPDGTPLSSQTEAAQVT